MTTLNDLVEEIRSDYLLTGDVEMRNRLGALATVGATTLTLERANTGFVDGSRIEIGYEDLYLVTGSQSSNQIEVERGQFGSTAYEHPQNELVVDNPKYSKASILRAINRELDALSGSNRLFQMLSLSITFNSSVMGYDFTDKDAATPTDPDTVYSIWEIRAATPGSTADWPLLQHFQFTKGMPADEFPSTMALIFDVGGYPGRDMVVRYRAPFTQLDLSDPDFDPDDTDIAEVTGLPRSAEDLLALGAAIRLSAGKEIKRNFSDSQGTTRRPEEVPAGATLQSYGGLLKMYEKRIEQEKARLAAQYPVRSQFSGVLG